MKTKIITVIMLAGLVLLLLNPPWRITIKDDKGHTRSTAVKVGWLFDDPSPPPTSYNRPESTIATDVVFVELLAYATICAGVWYVAGPSKTLARGGLTT